jgi:GGDEF domain-containing protein
MLQTAEKNAGTVVRMLWPGQEDGCKFFLQAQIQPNSGTSVPEWTLRRHYEQDMSSLAKHMRGESNVFQMVTSDVGLLFNLIWQESTGTIQEVDQNRQSKAFDTLNNPVMKDIRLEYNPSAWGAAPAARPSAAPRQAFDRKFPANAGHQQGISQAQVAMQIAAAASVVLSGELTEMDLMGVLQSIKICDMVGRLDIRDRLSQIELFFEDGEVVHAVYTNALAGDAHQTIVGDRVILDALTWERGTFIFNKALKTAERSVKRRLQGLLLEGASLRDYRLYLQEVGVNESTVLEQTQQLTAEEAQHILEDGIGVDIAKQLQLYSAIDGKTALGEIVQQLGMSRSIWLPIAFNILNCQLASASDGNQSTTHSAQGSTIKISQKAVAVAARELLRPDTGMVSFPLFMHFLQLECARFIKQKSIFSIALFDFKNKTEPASQTALQEMAQCFDSIKDEFQHLGHYGDLGFAILLPLQNAAESKIILESFAAKLAQTKLHGFRKPQDLQLFFGVADAYASDTTVASLLKDADDAKMAAIKQNTILKTIAECRWERLRSKAATLRGADYEMAKAIWLDALIEARRIGGRGANLEIALEALSEAFMNLKEYSEAEPCTLELLTLKKYLHGPGDPSVLKVGNTLVECYCAQGRADEAERMQQQVVRSYVQAIGNTNPEAVDAAYCLVEFYRRQEDFQKAGEACNIILEMATQIYGAFDPKTTLIKVDRDELLALASPQSDPVVKR